MLFHHQQLPPASHYQTALFPEHPFPISPTDNLGEWWCKHVKLLSRDNKITLVTLYFIYFFGNIKVFFSETKSLGKNSEPPDEPEYRFTCIQDTSLRASPFQSYLHVPHGLAWLKYEHKDDTRARKQMTNKHGKSCARQG